MERHQGKLETEPCHDENNATQNHGVHGWLIGDKAANAAEGKLTALRINQCHAHEQESGRHAGQDQIFDRCLQRPCLIERIADQYKEGDAEHFKTQKKGRKMTTDSQHGSAQERS